MLVITCRFAQLAAPVFKLDVSGITKQIVYQPVDVPSSVSISGSESVSCWLSWAYVSGVKYSIHGRDVCEYTYPAGKLRIWKGWAAPLIPGGMRGVPGWGGVPGRDGIGSGVGCLCQSGEDAPVPLRLHYIWGFFAVPFWQSRHLSVRFSWSVAGCLCITAFTF